MEAINVTLLKLPNNYSLAYLSDSSEPAFHGSFYFDEHYTETQIYFLLCLLSVLKYKDVEFNYPLPMLFVRGILDYFGFYFDEVFTIRNTSVIEMPVTEVFPNTADDPHLAYTGGKDSFFSFKKKKRLKKIAYSSNLMKLPPDDQTLFIRSNFDDVFYTSIEPKFNKIEFWAPFILGTAKLYLGIEKELWENSLSVFGISFDTYSDLLSTYGILYDSVARDYSCYEITHYLQPYFYDYIKCDESKLDFCYNCQKCNLLFLEGADLENNHFNRDMVKQKMLGVGTATNGEEVIYKMLMHTADPTIQKIKAAYADAYKIGKARVFNF